MEQYLDAKIKRFTQKQLFKKITKVKTMQDYILRNT